MSANAGKADKAAGGKKPIVMMLAGIVIAVALMFVGKTVLGGSTGKDKEKEKKEVEVGVSVPLDEFLVNLSGGGDHYLKTTIALGMKKGITEDQVKEKTAPIRDSILTVLSAKTVADVNKAEGRDKLKDELKQKVNEACGDDNVVKIYFTAFATQ